MRVMYIGIIRGYMIHRQEILTKKNDSLKKSHYRQGIIELMIRFDSIHKRFRQNGSLSTKIKLCVTSTITVDIYLEILRAARS